MIAVVTLLAQDNPHYLTSDQTVQLTVVAVGGNDAFLVDGVEIIRIEGNTFTASPIGRGHLETNRWGIGLSTTIDIYEQGKRETLSIDLKVNEVRFQSSFSTPDSIHGYPICGYPL